MDNASVQRGLQKALGESSKSTKPKNDAELAPTDSDASSCSSSPDQCCSICLGKFKDKSFSDGCFHRFCFQCIREWAKVKSTCPLCKTPFKSIIHNVVSSDVYDQYVLQPSENGSFELDHGGARFRYHTTLTNNRRSAWETRMDQLFNRQARLAERIHRENEARQRRQLIYAAGLRVHHIASNRFTRFRETSPHFFRENPAMTHRLIPWLRRDLGVLFNGNADHVTFMTQYILSLLPNVDLQTEEFHNHLRPFLYGRTEHFIHEFTSFARSPHDMDTYDQMAQYDFRPENPQFTATLRPQMPLVAQENSSSNESDNNHSNNNDEVIVISDDDDDNNVDESTSNPLVLSLENSQSHDVPRDNRGPLTAADVAGPSTSFDLALTHNPEPPTGVDYNQPGPSGVNLPSVQIKQEEDSAPARNDAEQSENSSGSVEIVGYQKPYHLRTPIAFITISDDSTDEVKPGPGSDSKGKLSRCKTSKTPSGATHQEKAGGKRKQKTKHTRTSHSASKTGNWSTDSDESYYRSRHDRHYKRSQESEDRRDGSRPTHWHGRNASRSPHELYRKINEEKNKWSLYYETRLDYHSSSRSVSSSKSRNQRSRSRSKSSYSRRYAEDYHYDDYSRSREHSRERHSRDDRYWRRGSRSRSRDRSREGSRERSRQRRDEHYRRRSRSRSRGFDPLSDERRHSVRYSSRYGSTSSTFSRYSQDCNPLRKDTASTVLEDASKASRSPEGKRKRESDDEKEKEGDDAHSKKKHKHKHKHHKRKSSRHKHKSKGKNKEARHKHDRHGKHKSKETAAETQTRDKSQSASDSTSDDLARGKSKKSKHSKKLQTFLDPNEPRITLQDLLNMDENISIGNLQRNDSCLSEASELRQEKLFETNDEAAKMGSGED